MQIVLFFLIVSGLSLLWLPSSQAIIFSLILLIGLLLGQMIVGFVMFVIDSLLYKLFGRSTSYETFLKGKIKKSVFLTRIITIFLIILAVKVYVPYLLLPSLVGILYWLVIENFGEKRYRLKLP